MADFSGIRTSEAAGLRLLYATQIIVSRSWRGVRMTPDTWWELEVLRRGAFGEQPPAVARELMRV